MLRILVLDTTSVVSYTLTSMSDKSYTVKQIPEAAWRKLRLRAMRESVKVKDLFARWIQRYAEGK